MSQDDPKAGGSSPDEATMPDEGMIHEWLDGELDADASARMEALVRSSPAFAAQVAEARGLLAASSRILQHLDQVPAGVIPVAAAASMRVSPSAPGASSSEGPSSGGPVNAAASRSASRTASHTASRVPWRRIGSIAALLMVGVTGVMIVRRDPAVDTSLSDGSPVSALSAEVATSSRAESRLQRVESDSLVAATGTASGARSAAAAEKAGGTADEAVDRTERVATTARPRAQALEIAAPGAPAKSEAQPKAAPEVAERAAAGNSVARLTDAAMDAARRVPNPESMASPVARTGGRVAADPALRPQIASLAPAAAAAAGAGAPAARAAAAAAPAARAAAADAAPAPEPANMVFPEVASDIAPADLALAVQRVRCTTSCEQIRVELATDGRARRWTQTLLSSTPTDSGRVDAAELGRLQQLVDSLDLASLPAMLPLDGSRCRSVAALRESLRVEFRHRGALRRVMGLPWCSDGTHVMDRVAAEAERIVARALERR
jgi:hypothetical protein